MAVNVDELGIMMMETAGFKDLGGMGPVAQAVGIEDVGSMGLAVWAVIGDVEAMGLVAWAMGFEDLDAIGLVLGVGKLTLDLQGVNGVGWEHC